MTLSAHSSLQCSFFTIRDVIKLYHPLALRFFLVSSQYRTAINYTQKSLEVVSPYSGA